MGAGSHNHWRSQFETSIDISEIRAQLRESLPNYALPKAIEIVEACPNAMGKVLRRLI